MCNYYVRVFYMDAVVDCVRFIRIGQNTSEIIVEKGKYMALDNAILLDTGVESHMFPDSMLDIGTMANECW